MEKKKGFCLALALTFLLLAAGCAVPVREAVRLDAKAPVGRIAGNTFIGERYPFKISAPPGWEVSTAYPKFLLDYGFDKEGLEASQVFVFNPATQANLQVDLQPAGRYSQFDQKKIEWLTTAALDSFQDELEKDLGKDVKSETTPTAPARLKGVPYAAKKYATYTVKGAKREQGWIYAFAEPFQIFILYLIPDLGKAGDKEALQSALDSFEFTKK